MGCKRTDHGPIRTIWLTIEDSRIGGCDVCLYIGLNGVRNNRDTYFGANLEACRITNEGKNRFSQSAIFSMPNLPI